MLGRTFLGTAVAMTTFASVPAQAAETCIVEAAKVTRADIEASHGVNLVIDGVIMPGM